MSAESPQGPKKEDWVKTPTITDKIDSILAAAQASGVLQAEEVAEVDSVMHALSLRNFPPTEGFPLSRQAVNRSAEIIRKAAPAEAEMLFKELEGAFAFSLSGLSEEVPSEAETKE